ncbi:hypothetical protein NQ317_001368 [Molorchus minor]|uniref:Uncharacterized protein n=1 Tax=Molorchus minor TaxID=1323400 RepID=A0ABQ9J7Q9_9CUCU|nr:hypothetical protein NQ317_001368 [Molorchus minor]
MLAQSFPRLGRALGIRLTPKKSRGGHVNLQAGKPTIPGKDLLQLLIDMMNDKDDQDGYQNDGSTMTMKEIVAQCFLFFLAGF